jgi:hypothetical protein
MVNEMNTKSLKFLLIALGLAVAFISSDASATASTHIWGPSTDIQAFKLWHVTSDFYLPVKLDDNGNRVSTVTNLGLTVGILPFKKVNAEIGFDHKSGLGVLDNYPYYGNLKIGVPEGAFGKCCPGLALGILDFGFKEDYTDFNIAYAKIAKTVSLGKTQFGRLSIGYFTGNENLLLDGEGEKDNSGVMFAWERTINEISDKFWLCAEYMGSKSAYGTLNFGAAWKFAPNVSMIAGYDIYNDDAFLNTATIQVDIDFSM